MHYASGVRGAEGTRDCLENARSLCASERTVSRQYFVERSAIDVFHDNVWHTVGKPAHAVDGSNIRMSDVGRSLSLALESHSFDFVTGQLGPQYFHCHQTLECGLSCQKHFGDGTPA